MGKACYNCHSFIGKKCFTSDGICYLVPSKPKFVKKNGSCRFWKDRKETK